MGEGRKKEEEGKTYDAEFGKEKKEGQLLHHTFCLKLLCLFPRKTTIQSMLFPFQSKHSQGHTALRLQGLFG